MTKPRTYPYYAAHVPADSITPLRRTFATKDEAILWAKQRIVNGEFAVVECVMGPHTRQHIYP